MSDSPRSGLEPHAFTKAQLIYVWLSGVFLASLLIADITGVKLFQFKLWGFTVQHTCGMLTFPITFLLTDLVNEYYGQRAARRMVWMGLAMGFGVFVVVNIALAMPAWDVPFNIRPGSFEDVFANSRVMYVASLGAFMIGNLCDIAVFGWIKRLTRGKMVWLRATGSTVISQFLDSFVVTWLAFNVGRVLFPTDAAPMPMNEVIKTAATGYTLKFVIAIAITPLIYLGRVIMSRALGIKPLPADTTA
jgi:uncharacterized integral membrane protein (TIGR00697 family)